MEEVVAELTVVRREAQSALDTELGRRAWQVSSPDGEVVVRSGCGLGEDPDGETAYLPGRGFRGTYPPSRWPDAARLVLEVARRHGFTDVQVLTDVPGDYLVEARRPDGAQLQFGLAINTDLSLQTGCHRWRTPPPPGPVSAGED